MVLVFDLDDTLCETDAYSEQYILNFIKQHNLPYKLIQHTARFAEKKFDWDVDTALRWYKQYGDEMMLNFPAKLNAVKVINRLHDLGHRIVIATARATDWHTNPKDITLQWLQNMGLKYDKLYIGRVDKELICEAEHADVFMDDDLNITSRVAEHLGHTGIQVFMATSDYNKDKEVPDGVVRVDDMKNMLREISVNRTHFKKNNQEYMH
ncbi:MAG: hypothetical protein J6Q15_00900 [Clostridia bacterium]|nr:hypothetical protein [Clostridia bacterium]